MVECFRALLHNCNSWSHLKQIHALLTTCGLCKTDPYAWKILSFAAASDINYAHRFFLHLSNPGLFHYNALIRGFATAKNPVKCFLIFGNMLLNGVVPDYLTYPFLAKAAARLSDPKLGAFVHGHILRTGLASDVFICNSLIHMYGSSAEIGSARKVFDEVPMRNLVSWNSMLDGCAKCGDMSLMREVFDVMPQRDVVSWSTLVDGYVKGGHYAEAMTVFGKMRAEGPKANEVTMVSILCACSHLGALDQGRAMHRYIAEERLPLTLILRTSLLDMYVKCGAIEEAMVLFREVFVPAECLCPWRTCRGGMAIFRLNHQGRDGAKERALCLHGGRSSSSRLLGGSLSVCMPDAHGANPINVGGIAEWLYKSQSARSCRGGREKAY